MINIAAAGGACTLGNGGTVKYNGLLIWICRRCLHRRSLLQGNINITNVHERGEIQGDLPKFFLSQLAKGFVLSVGDIKTYHTAPLGQLHRPKDPDMLTVCIQIEAECAGTGKGRRAGRGKFHGRIHRAYGKDGRIRYKTNAATCCVCMKQMHPFAHRLRNFCRHSSENAGLFWLVKTVNLKRLFSCIIDVELFLGDIRMFENKSMIHAEPSLSIKLRCSSWEEPPKIPRPSALPGGSIGD